MSEGKSHAALLRAITFISGRSRGVALLGGLKDNKSVEVFHVGRDHNRVKIVRDLRCLMPIGKGSCPKGIRRPQTGMAIVDVIKENATLTDYNVFFDDDTSLFEHGQFGETAVIFVSAVCQNSALCFFSFGIDFDSVFQSQIDHNRNLYKLCAALKLIAKPSKAAAFSSLKDDQLHRNIFSFFLPSECVPAQFFLDMGMVVAKQSRK